MAAAAVKVEVVVEGEAAVAVAVEEREEMAPPAVTRSVVLVSGFLVCSSESF